MENEVAIRLMVFLGLFALLASAEALLPRRVRSQTRKARWFTNISITVIDTLTVRLMAVLLPVLAVAAAADASAKGWGILGAVNWPNWLEILIAILVLDFVIWAQHLITHKVPLLWRLHRVHHADVDIDVTTAIRFHPIEIAISMLIKIGAVYILGPTALAVILFEIILNGAAMFNHANIKLPLTVDKYLRLILVTPDMHRVHHSVHRHEHDSNYGFSLSIWDRMFGTYIAQPEKSHDDMTIGLQWQDDRPSKLGWSLWLPFRAK
ncbi:sterol desaturase family protein [Amylibacter sp. SFDW26]|uniref:sterol desaturase family protein n=1 Tax=Amylibacter sp. SFDW26 TaxID=2652722 RepID=UPI0012614D54|nr:sterol desaturase family protein [Amylibacter sp. SFDW26]KAB7613293.1 sterol desaturase family protein [Amylibacter sp. SFDW26]